MSLKPNKNKWSDEEISLLGKIYGTMPNDELLKKHFPDKTKRSLKGQVERWNLAKTDYWSDREVELLKILTKHNLPAKTIASILNRPQQATVVKASKLGIVRKTRAEVIDGLEVKEQSKYKLLDANTKGTINENNAINILLENGFSIFKPITIGHETDFLILGETQLARIQVKTAIYDEKTKRYRCPLKAKSGKDGSRSAYKEESTDFFLVICPGSKSYYCFPLYVGLVTNFANLYPDRIKQYQKQAHDFEDWKNSTDCINEFLLQGKKRRTITEGNMIPNVTEEARFTHKKNWKDWEIKVLKILVENKIKYKSIANLLNRSYEGVLQKAIKLNIAGGKVSTNEIDDTQESHLKDITSNISSRTMGVISENTIINQLALRGLDVFIPCKTNDRVDAVIIDGSNFAKLQIKGGGYSKKEKSYGAELSTHNRKIRKLYSTDEIDFFLIYCRPWEDVYVIPRTATGKSLKIRLYPNRQKYDPESGYEHYKNKFNLLFQFIGKSQEQDF